MEIETQDQVNAVGVDDLKENTIETAAKSVEIDATTAGAAPVTATRCLRENLRSSHQRKVVVPPAPKKIIHKPTRSTSATAVATPASTKAAIVKENVDDGDERFDKNKSEKGYADLVRSLAYLRKFDWTTSSTNPSAKTPPVKFLTPQVFWFMICAEYFPRSMSIAQDPANLLEEQIAKIERQPVQQIIRIKEMGYSEFKSDKNSDEAIELDSITNTIKGLAFEKPLTTLRNTAELKEDYSIDDDLYIMNVRHDLLDFYSKIKAEAGGLIDVEKALKCMKKVDIDDLIYLYQYELSEQTKEIKTTLDNIKQQSKIEIMPERFIFSENELNFNDALVDIHYFSAIEHEYLNLLENKQQSLDLQTQARQKAEKQQQQHQKQTMMIRVERHENSNVVLEDLACQICNDGDYTDDDLIVFCSKCNVSVHQRCYGIPQIPQDDWICDLCLSFGPEGKYLRCVLCSQRGGAMKPSRIPVSSSLLSQINPTYAEYAATYCAVGTVINTKKLQRYTGPQSNRGGDEVSEKSESTQAAIGSGADEEEANNADVNQEQYYDFHNLKPFTNEELKNEPKPNFVWAHICCALWTPECYFDDKNHYTNVKGIESIDKQRFKLECSICKQKGGSCIQCAKSKCMEAFHPECARRTQRFMEIRNAEKLAYLIYCERHTPLKLRRQLESKEKKYKEEIVKFCRTVEKCREARKKELLNIAGGKAIDQNLALGDSKVGSSNKKMFVSAKKIRQQITKTQEGQRKEEKDYQMAVISQLILYIEQQKSEGEEGQESEKEKKKERNSRLLRLNHWAGLLMKDRENSFWSEVVFQGFSAQQVYKRFRKIQRDPERKKEFKNHYFTTLTLTRNIRIVTKEERAKELQKKLSEKHQRKQQRIEESRNRKNEKLMKKQRKQEKREQKIRAKNAKMGIYAFGAEENIEYEEEVPDDRLYCVCKQKYQDGEQMMACESCDEWYHFDCIGFQGRMEDAETFEFMCKFCDIAQADPVKSEERKNRYGHFFLNFDDANYEAFKRVVQVEEVEVNHPQIEVVKPVEVKAKKEKKAVKQSEKQAKKKKKENVIEVSAGKQYKTRKRRAEEALEKSNLENISKKLCVGLSEDNMVAEEGLLAKETLIDGIIDTKEEVEDQKDNILVVDSLKSEPDNNSRKIEDSAEDSLKLMNLVESPDSVKEQKTCHSLIDVVNLNTNNALLDSSTTLASCGGGIITSGQSLFSTRTHMEEQHEKGNQKQISEFFSKAGSPK